MIPKLCFLLLSLALAGSLNSQEPCRSAWVVRMGVQMPEPTRGPKIQTLTLYFKPPATMKPSCKIVFATKDAAIVDAQTGYITITGTPETRIDFECVEGKP